MLLISYILILLIIASNSPGFFSHWCSPTIQTPLLALKSPLLHLNIYNVDAISGASLLPLILIHFESRWTPTLHTSFLDNFPLQSAKDPLKLSQIGCGLLVNCEVQFAPQIFHSNFPALAGPMWVIQRFVLKPLVLAACVGWLPCWKVNLHDTGNQEPCSSSRALLYQAHFSVFIHVQFPNTWHWKSINVAVKCEQGNDIYLSFRSGRTCFLKWYFKKMCCTLLFGQVC